MTNEDTHNARLSRRGRRKAELLALLRSRKTDAILAWSQSVSDPLGRLSTALFENDPLIRWRAIEAIGLVAAEICRGDQEKVRSFVRRLLWLMNDESGGICWHAPEAIAEILYRTPELVEEYGPILVSFLNEEPFEVGVCLGIARLFEADDIRDNFISAVSAKQAILRDYLASGSAPLGAGAFLVLNKLGTDLEPGVVDRLKGIEANVQWYDFDSGELIEVGVGNILPT